MTINRFYLLLITLLTISTTSCDLEDRCIKGSGDIKSKTVNLTNFSGVDLRLPGNVEIIKSTTSKIEIQARENVIDHIRTDIVSNHLRLDMDNRCLKGKMDMTFKVYTSELNYLRVAGSGSINNTEDFSRSDWKIIIDGSGDIHSKVNGNNTEAVISGSGGMHLNGVTNQLLARISGSGNIHGYGLTTDDLNATISGSGNIENFVTKTIRATISGSGNIRYRGQPTITNISISGSGKVIKTN